MFPDSYSRIRTRSGPAFVGKEANVVKRADSVVFDCDGVLIDVRKSYDMTTAETVDRMLQGTFGLQLPWKRMAPPLIHRLRRTGGFNNDWDTTYVLSLFAACSLPATYRERMGSPARHGKLAVRELSETLSRIEELIEHFERVAIGSGHESVDDFVGATMSSDDRVVCDFVRAYAGYPGIPPSSLLATLFDEMYHGPALYAEMYGFASRYYKGRGFIEDDKLLVKRAELESLTKSLDGRLALATGRPRKAAEYSLGHLMSLFQLDASVFIGDADLKPSAEKELNAFRKPSGLGLLYAREKLKSKNLIYVGDSAEDLKMVQNARRSFGGFAFAGIYGTAYDPEDQIAFFKRGGAELILPSVGELPGILDGEMGR